MNRIAILVTCHNRRETTISCLQRLFEIKTDIDVYCVDDKSSDGTSDAIASLFPQVIIIHGNGELFWSRGMRLAWEKASMTHDYDFYFWLNDDVELFPNCFEELLFCSSILNDRAIIGGLIKEKNTGQVIYGGYDNNHCLIPANGKMNPIRNLNGNFVLISRYVFNVLGNLDPVYHHDIGDVDYGFMAQENDIPVVTSRDYIGTTNAKFQTTSNRIRQYGVGVVERFQKLYSPLGAPPSIHFHFMKKHKGFFTAVFYYLYLHIINVLPDSCWNSIKNRRK